VGRQRTALGPWLDVIARRGIHRPATVTAWPAYSSDELSPADFPHDCD
jgi:hypothetical protein